MTQSEQRPRRPGSPIRRALAPLLLAAILAGCGTVAGVFTSGATKAPPPVRGEEVKVGQPYKIGGNWYYPAYDPGYDQIGLASWYGKQFHGKKTASGERFDMNSLTAAHKTLPLPSYVKVTNLSNGRSLVLRVNDRGPFAPRRILDVSRRAAQLLGFERKGVERVRVEVVNPDGSRIKGKGRRATTRRAASGAIIPGMLYVQLGSFANYGNAMRLVDGLREVGDVFIQSVRVSGRTVYRVRVGPFSDVKKAKKALKKIRKKGFREARIFTEPGA